MNARFSVESIAGFSLAVFLGSIGCIAYNSVKGWKKMVRIISMALFVGYAVDSFAWWKDLNPELRAFCVVLASGFAEPIITYMTKSKIVREEGLLQIIKQILGINGKSNSNDRQ